MSVGSDRVSGEANPATVQSLSRPLNEVACGVRFVAPDFDIVQFGQFYETVKEHFPRRQMVAAIPTPPSGSFGSPIIEIPTLPRLWLINDSRLLQLQIDRFIYNWRRIDDSVEQYPGFNVVFDDFFQYWSDFISFADRAFEIPIKITELSLTYVNQIHDDGTTAAPIFAFRKSDFDMPKPDLWVSQIRFPFPEANLRISVGARPAIHLATQVTVAQLDMNVESIAPPETMDELRLWYSSAHKVVHRTFKALIESDWLSKWGFTP